MSTSHPPVSRLFESIEKFGSAIAVVEENGNLISYEELARRADKIASVLGGRCLVSIDAANELPPLLAYLGACRAGCPVILVDHENTTKDPRIRVTFGPSFHFGRTATGWGFTDLRRGGEPGPDDLHPELAVLLSTSGSTGSPKLVRLSVRNLSANALSIAEYLQIQPTDRAITTLPFNYSFGLSVLNSHLLTGASISLCTGSVLDTAFWFQFERDGITNFAGVPRTFELLEHAGFLKRSHVKLTHFIQAGGRLAPEKVKIFAGYARRIGARFYVMYGQTEASPRMAYLPPHLADAHPDCIGIAIPGGRFDIEDFDGQPVETPNTPGILCYRGPNVMMGYAQEISDLRNPHELEKLVTGDIALKNTQGLYQIVGRASRFVKVAGLRLSLDDIQDTVESRGLVSAVAGDDTLIAVAVKASGEAGPLQGFLRERFGLPPGSIEVIDVPDLPRFSSGKVNFPAILEAAKTKRERDQSRNIPMTERFRTELAAVLGRTTLHDDETFAQAGGDSLNYVEGALVVEKYRGKAIIGWDRTAFRSLSSAGDMPRDKKYGQMDPIVIARALAITLAIGSHCFLNFGLWPQLPEELRLISRAATPSFLVLFGWMLARSYVRQGKRDSLRTLHRRFLPNAAILFGAAVLVHLSAFVGNEIGFRKTINAIFLLGRGVFGNILSIYSVFFLVTPLLIVALRRNAWLAIVLIVGLGWGTWALFRDFETSVYALSFFFGIGKEFGPSILQGLTLVLFGFALGDWSRSSVARFTVGAFAIAAVLVASFQLSEGGAGEYVRSIATIDLRWANHPYYYAYGILAASILLAFAHLITPRKPPRFDPSILYSLGTNPMFAFGFGNIALGLIPNFRLSIWSGVPVTILFILILGALTADISQAKPIVFGPIALALRKVINLCRSTIRKGLFEGRV